ncbi:MAG: aldehyde ferredoxin oxidoreductase family protein [Dehalococcoidales bacterium]|nr:aldehyde ferredoxin oxidoreductase family protein [Dehalococcoidales bacterium]
MPPGYMGKILWVNLSSGEIKTEALDEKLCRDFVGGYGIGAKFLYDRMKPKVDPLGPENILGLITGPLTGSPIPATARYAAVAKSPLTGGWGDANCGGDFGPYLKFSGYDGVFFTGISPKPVYLLIDSGKAELKDASDLWGKTSYETEDTLMARYGSDCRVACIGPAGEKLSLISCIITDHGSAAGRSGLGAVMGSKKLKAVVAKGNMPIKIADKEAAEKLRNQHIKDMQVPGFGGIDSLRKYGTSAMTDKSAHSGDTPVRNWGGVGIIDLPNVEGLKPDVLLSYVAKHGACWHCPVACKATLKEGKEYKYPAGTRRPEYETQASFGANCGNAHTESINMVNYICNGYGLDTISAGTVIGFAIECYENGILTKKDTGGIDLRWGNHQAIVAMTEKLAKREGLGDILADGVKRAAEKIGKGAEKFAVHIGGQEVGMHDPKLGAFSPSASARYQMDATPGRHTQGFGPSSFPGHIVNASGLCLIGFGFGSGPEKLAAFLNAVTGFNYTTEEVLKAGERIAVLRHLFNLREGIREIDWKPHGRIIGEPPQKEGPLAGVTIDQKAQIYWNLGALDWDLYTTKPSRKKLIDLGFPEIAEELWPPRKGPPGPP